MPTNLRTYKKVFVTCDDCNFNCGYDTAAKAIDGAMTHLDGEPTHHVRYDGERPGLYYIILPEEGGAK